MSLNNHEHLQAEERDKGLQIVLANLKAKTCQRIETNVLFSVGDLLPDLEKKTKTILLKDSADTAESDTLREALRATAELPADIFTASCIWNKKTNQFSLVGSKKILQTYFYDEVAKKALAQEEQ